MRWSIPVGVVAAFLAGCGSSAKTTTIRMGGASMEPTLHCATPTPGCLGDYPDRLTVRLGSKVARRDLILFEAPQLAAARCGTGGRFVQRVIALPGETWEERSGYIYINGKKLEEPYVRSEYRDSDTHGPAQRVPAGEYVVLGDNRAHSCDSRVWGPVSRLAIVGTVVAAERASGRVEFP